MITSGIRILHPEPNEYTAWTMTVMAAAVLVKTGIGFYTKRQGKKLESGALSASGQDALNDAGATLAALAAALIYVFFNIYVEAFVGFLISFLILRTGFETLHETVSSLLGERADLALAAAVKNAILSFPEVDDVFGLAIHNYGVGKLIGSAHIEVPESLTAGWIDNLQRSVSEKVLADTGVEMLGLTIYAVNSSDQEAAAMRERILKITEEHGGVKAVHGFYVDRIDRVISFEAETDSKVSTGAALRDQLTQKIQQEYPRYSVRIQTSSASKTSFVHNSCLSEVRIWQKFFQPAAMTVPPVRDTMFLHILKPQNSSCIRQSSGKRSATAALL